MHEPFKEKQFLYDNTEGRQRVWITWHVLRDLPFRSKWNASRHCKVQGVGEAANKMFSLVSIDTWEQKLEDIVTHSVLLVQSGDLIDEDPTRVYLGQFKHQNARWLVFYEGWQEGRL